MPGCLRKILMMARTVGNLWSHSKTVILIWFLCFFIYFMALKNSSSDNYHSSSSSDSNREQRSRLYDKMEKDLDEKGLAFLKHGQTSQSLSLSDLFTIKDGYVTPVLKVANPPVRANVLYLDPEYSLRIADNVKNTFSSYFNKAIWFQNSSVYHFSMFHASHHIEPVPATEDEIEAEANAVKAVADSLCPLKIVLDRVVLTSTGVLLGCWQVISGSDPVTVRAKLRTALPHAPKKQLYDDAILHTSFARVLGHPTSPMVRDVHTFPVTPQAHHPKFCLELLMGLLEPDIYAKQEPSDELRFFHELVAILNNKLRGFEAVVSELWYVEEYDVLALALDGRMKIRKFKLGCRSA